MWSWDVLKNLFKKYKEGKTIPDLDNRAICITTRNNTVLPALVSSYFSKPYKYFSVFIFPDIDVSYEENPNEDEDKFIAKIIGREAKVLINNAIVKLRPKYYILAGLNTEEKSYFNFLPGKRKIIIDTEAEIPQKLSKFRRSLYGELYCKRGEILKGLFIAKRKKRSLVIKEDAPTITLADVQSSGIVVMERMEKASDIVSINFAFSIGANLEIVLPFNEEKGDITPLKNHIHKWKREASASSLEKIKRKVNKRISQVNFSKYEYASFITGGLPYSLVVTNIPTCYINPNLRCDLFIFNGIISERESFTEGALVFSPEEFNDDEETPYVITKLKEADFFVKEITGRDATVRNLENYVQHYPYDLLHICSHGGEIDGYFAVEKYTDRNGKQHSIEFEEAVGFAPIPGKNLISVTRKVFFKRFDGFQWMSKEMKTQRIPNYVFEDLRKYIFVGDGGVNAKRIKANYPITSSCHIKCFDSIHHGNFQSIALYNNPIIFNNTCGSWYEISHFFINYGAKGYIGTLWSIKNENAKRAAELFYTHAVDRIIPDICFLMNRLLKNTTDENIYIYWGLPFTRIRKPDSRRSKINMLSKLLYGLNRWVEHLKNLEVCASDVKRNTEETVAFIRSEIISNFKPSDLKALLGQVAFEQLIKETTIKARKRQATTVADTLERGVIDLGSEIKRKNT